MYQKIGRRFGKDNSSWKGDEVEYRGLHRWIQKWKGEPSKCEKCGTRNAKRFDWANKSGEYKRDLDDWIRLCRGCNLKIDFNDERRSKVKLQNSKRLRNNKGQFVN